ncbi:MAG: ribosome maturation factor RimP [Calditrichia bacterium]
MKKEVEEITDLIKPVLDSQNVYLVDVVLKGSGRERVLTVYADTLEGITLEQITRLNRELSDVLDMNDAVKGSYRLEVSSPGVDRPLKFLWQYEKNMGRQLRVLFEDQGKTKEIKGKLISLDENNIVVKSRKNETVIPFSSIKKAKVIVTF